MSSNDISISARNLTKIYRIFGHPADRIKQAMAFGLRKYHREFTALKDISFDIRKGEAVGIIGRNGSGKSTLLQIVCGIIAPTDGSVKVDGRVSALLELGAGFNPEFTGRENIYFQGALMGVTKAEMEMRFDDIATFADIGQFIDQPVRTYSSGMFVRLAFASIIHADADILVIDEALAVGDEAFQRKCFDKLATHLENKDKVLLFVSHNIRQVERICSQAIWLEQGRIARLGASAEVCDAYHNDIYASLRDIRNPERPHPNISDSGEVEVHDITLLSDQKDRASNDLEFHAPARLIVDFLSHTQLVAPEIVIGFHTIDSVFIAAASTATLAEPPSFPAGEHRIECRISDMILLPGTYQVRLGFFDRHRRRIWAGHHLCAFSIAAPIGSNLMRTPLGLVDMPFEWVFGSDVPPPE